MSDLFSYYQKLLRIRRVEEAIAGRYSEQKMRCPTHLSIGQEAVAVGVSAFLHNKDKVYSSHRAHAHYLAKGGSLQKLIAELYGKETGCTGGRGGSMHLSDLDAGFVASTAIVGNSIPLAVGNALHQQTQKLQEISVTYFGEGATEEGVFYESANFAAVKKLPVLFICENNGYSVYSPLHVRQPKGRSIVELARAIGVDSKEVDGNDVIQVANMAAKSIQSIREGHGPILLECHTYRHREHCGPNWDDDLAYRPQQEVAQWLDRDPIAMIEKQLLLESPDNQGHIDDANLEIQQEIIEAFAFAEHSTFPSLEHNNRFLYA
ncbi:thiamine pyrophosphate-dependent dehydrogenase E1 component subunit alpha [Aliiglaciecola sp. NS0011-25]|uniref:thiamine pyrophosphate-dependent dehydrogenase E1 component subunit alpha n=1 Tax=Aliiglaciecola sp. NS0011-25 TaxID=3127654 RepID=UPI0031047D28